MLLTTEADKRAMISQAAMKKKRQAQAEMFGCEPDIGGAVQRRADAPLTERVSDKQRDFL